MLIKNLGTKKKREKTPALSIQFWWGLGPLFLLYKEGENSSNNKEDSC